jgi:hypothetical protein
MLLLLFLLFAMFEVISMLGQLLSAVNIKNSLHEGAFL